MPITELTTLLADLKPRLEDKCYVFCSVAEIPAALTPLATFVEKEGISLICRQQEADALKLPYDLVMKMIALEVYSSLEAVGMTAAVSKLLTKAGISANVVAAYHHDYIFVAQDKAQQALELLQSIR